MVRQVIFYFHRAQACHEHLVVRRTRMDVRFREVLQKTWANSGGSPVFQFPLSMLSYYLWCRVQGQWANHLGRRIFEIVFAWLVVS